MINLLKYNYNIDIEKYQTVKNGISFYINYEKFYLYEFNRVPRDIELIYNEINGKNTRYHQIIKNRFGELLTDDNNKKYILIKVNGPENNEVDIYDILNSTGSTYRENNDLNRMEWGKLWSEKVDYLEYQVSELGLGHPIIIKSFSYYVGLAENAIEYFNYLKTDDVQLVLSHKRLTYPCSTLEFNNPLSLVIDYRVRDISEYIKSKFFCGDNVVTDIKKIISKNIFSEIEYNLLFDRLLFPSYYFDELSAILEGTQNDDDLIKYTSKIHKYEIFLKKVYELFSKQTNLLKVDWIIKKQE